MSAGVVYGVVNQNGTYSILARVTDLTASGVTVKDKEGPCIKQMDVQALAARIFDLGTNKDNQMGTQILPNPPITAVTSIYDTLQFQGWPTEQDKYGYNFRHDVGTAYTAQPGHWYLVEYIFTLISGSIGLLKAKVKTVPTQ
jgi:hypothetical protein